MRGRCIPGLTGKDSRNHRNIKMLNWDRQWDIALFSGRKHINMTITRIEGMELYLHTPEIPGYEQLIKVETMIVDTPGGL